MKKYLLLLSLILIMLFSMGTASADDNWAALRPELPYTYNGVTYNGVIALPSWQFDHYWTGFYYFNDNRTEVYFTGQPYPFISSVDISSPLLHFRCDNNNPNVCTEKEVWVDATALVGIDSGICFNTDDIASTVNIISRTNWDYGSQHCGLGQVTAGQVVHHAASASTFTPCEPYHLGDHEFVDLPCSYNGIEYDSAAVEAYVNTFFFKGSHYILSDNGGTFYSLDSQYDECDGLLLAYWGTLECRKNLAFAISSALFFGVGASYNQPTHTLTITIDPQGGGSVTSEPVGVTCSGNTCQGSFPQGTTVTLTEHNTSGYSFEFWDIDDVCYSNQQTTVTMDGDKTLTAKFIQESAKLTITIDPPEGGSVASDPTGITCSSGTCQGYFPQGSTVALTELNNAGYVFEYWDNGSGQVNNNSTQVTMDSDKTILAKFTKPILWGMPVDGISYCSCPVDVGTAYDSSNPATWFTMAWSGKYTGTASGRCGATGNGRCEGTGGHPGVDIVPRTAGSKTIKAIGPGTVIESKYNSGFGNYVIIEHNDPQFGNFYSIYCHLADLTRNQKKQFPSGRMVNVGDIIENAGTQIGIMGSTGNSGGTHLHFQIDKKSHPVYDNKGNISYKPYWTTYSATSRNGRSTVLSYPSPNDGRLTSSELQSAVQNVQGNTYDPIWLINQLNQ